MRCCRARSRRRRAGARVARCESHPRRAARPRARRSALKAIIVAIVCIAAPAWAHKPSDAHVRLVVEVDRITGRLDVAVRDLDAAIGVDTDGNGEITWAELQAAPVQAY